MSPPLTPLPLWGGVECTINRVGDSFHRQFDWNGHRERISDLDRIADLGIRTLRFPLLWEDLAPDRPEEIDWSWSDRWMQRLQELQIRPIAGLLHHGSGPRYTSLVDPHFPEMLASYARAVAERYPWIDAYTPVNEPLTTARFSGLYGHWYPHGGESQVFYRALLQELRGTVLAMKEIRQVNPTAQLIQTEDLGKTYSTPRLDYQAEFDNERRWLSLDLLTGSLVPGSRIWEHMIGVGIGEEELVEFLRSPCPPQIFGVNHYVTSSRFLDENIDRYPAHLHGGNGTDSYVDIDAVRARPEGCCEPRELLREAWERFKLPVAITEAHIGCTREEQIRWVHEIYTAASQLRDSGAEVVAVTAWSLFGAYDWNSLLTVSAGSYESGAFDLRGPEPRATALAPVLRDLATTGTCRHPLLRVPGWWRRNIRVLPQTLEETRTRWQVRKVFMPASGRTTSETDTPMLLITGASGTLGQAFARICYLRGIPYRLLDRAEMDIVDPVSVRTALTAFRPWAIINAAGYVRVDDAETDEANCFRSNADGPVNLARACAEANIRLLSFSSDLVFDGTKGGPYVESDASHALNVYGRSKIAAEAGVAAVLPQALMVRTSAFFSPWDVHNFVSQALSKLGRGERFPAADDLLVSPTYVPDLVHAALDLLIDGESGIWHLANSGAVSWFSLAQHAARHAGLDEDLVEARPFHELGLAASRPVRSTLTSERGQLLGNWEGALQRYFHDRALLQPSSLGGSIRDNQLLVS